MKIHLKSLLLLVIPVTILLCTRKSAAAYTPTGYTNKDTCLVKKDFSYDFPDSLRKKINLLIEDKLSGGINEKGVVTWENSPDAPEYYQVILRKNKITMKYKGTVCLDQDKMVWDNFKSCDEELKKLLNK
ncbi:hypothetical protein [Chitinophaga sp. Cy-1792]|uniref:hypothetical protein n=1 Tax=Chitinophaga sp. Cy-1792 TaxID=2608339 RepID=UPI001423A3BE|nr:hypothetical protein [Chitinophaga sp. Cy-1792]NIG56853.1 hypothetical protein [Chitinophaga sp. Cy-1792]